VRKLERLLGRKTTEVEILKEALELARAKNRPCCRSRRWRSIPEDTHDAGIIERRDAGRPQRGPLSALATSSSPVQSVAWSTRDRPMGTAGSPRS